MEFIYYFKKVVLENYFNFHGRARRSEYWYFCLACFIANLVFQAISTPSTLGAELSVLNYIGLAISLVWGLVMIIPSLAVLVRRLHDYGKSGWWILLVLIPLIGGIILLVWCCKAGETGANKWGPDPKNPSSEDDVMKAFEN